MRTFILLLASLCVAGAAITIPNDGTPGGASSGNVTPGMPSGWAVDDIFLLSVVSNDNVAHSLPAGWTAIVQGNCGANTRLSMWWRRAQSGDSAPTVTHTSGSNITSRIQIIRGANGGGSDQAVSPFDVVSTSVTCATSSPIAIPALTTTYSNDLAWASYGGGASSNPGWSSASGATTNYGNVDSIPIHLTFWESLKTSPGSVAVGISWSVAPTTGYAGALVMFAPSGSFSGTVTRKKFITAQ